MSGIADESGSRSLLLSVLESPERIVIFSLDREYRYTAFNRNHRETMARIWGRTIALGDCMLDHILDEGDRGKARASFDRALGGERFVLTEAYGEPPNRFVYENNYNPILDADGAVIGLTVFLTDITGRVQVEEELRRTHERLEELVEERTRELREANQRLAAEVKERRHTQQLLERAQRLEALGTLAGGVAHDFNNLLTVVIGYADVLSRRLPDGSPQRGYIDRIHSACRHGADLTSRLLAFSRRQVLQRTFLDPREVVLQAADFLEHVMPDTLQVQVDLAPRLPSVRADRGQLEQVLLNLALNARDAMDGYGRLEIRAYHVAREGLAEERREACPAGAVRVDVEDTGAGMDPELVERIFDPFFTTKEAHKGSGLGLSMVYGIVEQHEGWIDVRSKPGRGTTMIVWLPAHDVEPDARESPSTQIRRLAGQGCRVLVVDDEVEVASVAKELLTDAGFAVDVARDAAEAEAAFAGARFDALVTDVVLPGEVDGLELAERSSARQERLAVVLVSGYRDAVDPERVLALRRSRYLSKPYQPAVLVAALVELLER